MKDINVPSGFMIKEELKFKNKQEEDKYYQNYTDFKDIKANNITIGKLEYIPHPTYLYKVGERVQHGAIDESRVVEVLFDGKIIKLFETITKKERFSERVFSLERYTFVTWIDIQPYITPEENKEREIIKDFSDIRINTFNNDMRSLLHKVYKSGVDFNPEYQRGNVWSLEDKVKLIDSVFRNIEIGKFVFRKLPYSSEYGYEIIDGKQRLTALCEFYEGRFKYRGKLYRELSYTDKNHFKGYPITVGEIENVTQEQVYKTFLKMNVCGHIQEKEHIEHVEKLLKECK